MLFERVGRRCGSGSYSVSGTLWDVCLSFFFFQAEDGIRDLIVTGVQTCALPICELPAASSAGLAGCESHDRCDPGVPRLPVRRRPGRLGCTGLFVDRDLAAAAHWQLALQKHRACFRRCRLMPGPSMTESIAVESLSKRYELGASHQETQLRDQLVRLLRAPFGKRAPKEVIWALRDVSFTVQQGEVVGIIGRNGAGKSTLLKILSKITYPTSGRVRARGRVAALLEVGAGFHEELTGRENIFLNGSIMGMKKKEVDAKLEAIVEFSGLQRFIDTPIKRYSTGMRSRLGFAVAAHLDPDVLIVDEVLAGGDAGFPEECVSAMDRLRGGGGGGGFVAPNMAGGGHL